MSDVIEDISIEDLLKEVKAYLIVALSKFNDREDIDDLLQEGMIRAWKDHGQYSKRHILHRARQWATNMATQQRLKPTGHTRISSDAVATKRGEETRGKIKQYREEYFNQHGKVPTQREIAEAIGLSEKTINKHFRFMRANGETAVKHYDQYGSPDYSHLKPVSTETLLHMYNHDSFEDSHLFASHSSPSAEEQVMEKYEGLELLEDLNPLQRANLYAAYWLDWPGTKRSEHFTAHVVNRGVQPLRKALA